MKKIVILLAFALAACAPSDNHAGTSHYDAPNAAQGAGSDPLEVNGCFAGYHYKGPNPTPDQWLNDMRARTVETNNYMSQHPDAATQVINDAGLQAPDAPPFAPIPPLDALSQYQVALLTDIPEGGLQKLSEIICKNTAGTQGDPPKGDTRAMAEIVARHPITRLMEQVLMVCSEAQSDWSEVTKSDYLLDQALAVCKVGG